jgi:hypothetical protein
MNQNSGSRRIGPRAGSYSARADLDDIAVGRVEVHHDVAAGS